MPLRATGPAKVGWLAAECDEVAAVLRKEAAPQENIARVEVRREETARQQVAAKLEEAARREEAAQQEKLAREKARREETARLEAEAKLS